MCERMRFQVKDKDFLSKDDCIGTFFLKMSQISATGDKGFLPTFGPCFVNCYGSLRELTAFSDKYDYLNEGIIEGVAYRGRVMVEVDMKLGELPAKKTEKIKIVHEKKMIPFLRRCKYKLFGSFFSATMISPHNEPVEFEVSIGNYGSKLDENSPVQSSTTLPSNPVYDGNAYYYLPWMDHKPCVEVDSQWEDCLFRIESLNLLIFLVDSLQKSLYILRKNLPLAAVDVDKIKEDTEKSLDDLMKSWDEKFPPLPDEGITRLDKLIWEKRDEEWKQLRKNAETLRQALINERRDKELEKSQEDVVKVETKQVEKISDQSKTAMKGLKALETALEDIKFGLKALAVEPQNCIPDVIIWMLSGGKRVAVKRIPSHELMYSPKGEKYCGKHCGKLQTLFLTPPAVEKQKELEHLTDHAQVRLLLWLGQGKENVYRRQENEEAVQQLEEKIVDIQKEWRKNVAGEVAIFAETYENKSWLVGNWVDSLEWPSWSDVKGRIKQPKAAFENNVPPGWSWEGNWIKKTEHSVALVLDESVDEWMEDIFEYQQRNTRETWPDESKSTWVDMNGDELIEYDKHSKDKTKVLKRDDISALKGWVWKGDWEVDKNRAVDGDGWEYSLQEKSMAWLPYERNSYLCRRRLWVRKRVRDESIKKKPDKEKEESEEDQGWEYARFPYCSYHQTRHKLDFARRRRWIRKLVCDKPGHKAIFNFVEEEKKKKKKHSGEEEYQKYQQVPHLYLVYKYYHTYQFIAYIYQARDMYAGDRSGLSDPYVKVSISHYSRRTRVIKKSVSPTWDQTIIIEKIRFYEGSDQIKKLPPPVALEFYDKDIVGKDEFIGNCTIIPTIRQTLDLPSLHWYDITRYTLPAGEVLAAFELLDEDEMPSSSLTPSRETSSYAHYMAVPNGVRPILQKMRVEVLCWGVRDMKRYQLLHVNSPLVEIECGGVKKQSEHIKDAKENPNFPNPAFYFDAELPQDDFYAPSLNIYMYDKRSFGRQPIVGTYVVKSLKTFYVDRVFSPEQSEEVAAAITKASSSTVTPAATSNTNVQMPKDHTIVELEKPLDPESADKSDFDWWSKYYHSLGNDEKTEELYKVGNYDKIEIYDGEMEDEFDRFQDLIQTFPLYRGKGARDCDEHGGQIVGYFKGSVKIYPLPMDDESLEPEKIFRNIPSNDPVDVIVRVYVIRGLDLQAQDLNGKSDPYLKVSIGGKNVVNDKENYVPANLNPLFGKMFEFPATLPRDRSLKITVMDWDRFTTDDLIGVTEIDLENRFFSQYRASCGLSATISRKGPNRWRDVMTPKQIMEEWIQNKKYPAAIWSDSEDGTEREVVVNGVTTSIDKIQKSHKDEIDDPDERLALKVLREQTKEKFVPEHIESRSLYNPLTPKIPQGKLHMWVDIFPANTDIPDPVDVSLRKPDKYVLRVVVYNTSDVLLDEKSIATGEDMSDIYVKGWLRGEDKTQKTDVHYRSMDGEGNFNWRLVFPLEYIPAENIMVVRKKDHLYSLTETERSVPAILTMQIWDNDKFNPDDFLGTMNFNLNAMREPVSTAWECSLKQLENPKRSDLFKRKRMKGWWPSYDYDNEAGKDVLNGKMELEFELLTEEEAQLRPAGKGREDPNMNPVLYPPNRPATSFLWLTSPLKTCKFIVWKYYKWHIIGTVVVIFLIILIIVVIYTAPNTAMSWLTNHMLP